ncbi:MAG: hypothetical protein LC754_02035 [Acidobacteria bacterium]|nr:hypothetical protein [Acidobacteriota bacterium]
MGTVEGGRAGELSPERTRLNYFNYFTEIEDIFIRRRGKHLLLGTLDWALMSSWKEMGVPLHVVLRGIEKTFDSYEARPRKRSVKTLFYCQEEVEAQFAEWLESQRGANVEGSAEAGGAAAQEDETDARGLPFPRAVITAHLAESRAALQRSLEERPGKSGADELSEALTRAASRLEDLEKDFALAARPNAEQLENSLTDLENLLDRALRASLTPEQIERSRSLAVEQLRAYRSRMERATYEQTLENLLAKLLREECGIPRLSLFYL